VKHSDFILPEAFFASEQGGPSYLSFQNVSIGGLRLPSHFMFFDYAASTPLHRQVFSAMEPWLFAYFGNPAARLHSMGALADAALNQSRASVADVLGVDFEELIFTSSATESNNLFLRGLVENPRRKRSKIAFVATEHSSVIATAQALAANFGASLGICCEELPVDINGLVDVERAKTIVDDSTLAVCIMDVNNETGVVQTHLPEIVQLAHDRGAVVHVDAVQGFARGNFFARNLDWDSLVISSAKIYGPRGAAVLAVRRRSPRIRLEAQLTGGGHEFGLRSSTPNVAAVVGFAQAVLLQHAEREERNRHYEMLSKEFCRKIRSMINITIHGEYSMRAPSVLMMSIPDVNSVKLVENIGNIAISVGSACRSLHASASHVLLAMGVNADEAHAAFRVSFGVPNTLQEVVAGAEIIAEHALEMQKQHGRALHT
jgi:cysteine desulfurase